MYYQMYNSIVQWLLINTQEPSWSNMIVIRIIWNHLRESYFRLFILSKLILINDMRYYVISHVLYFFRRSTHFWSRKEFHIRGKNGEKLVKSRIENKIRVVSLDESAATRCIFRPVIKLIDRRWSGNETKRTRNIVIPKQQARDA